MQVSFIIYTFDLTNNNNMKIDFTFTAFDDKTNEVQYFDTEGKMLAKYPMREFQLWCDKKLWDKSETEVDAYIDDSWISLTTEYFNLVQPEPYPFGHKAGFTHIQKVK